VRNYLAVPDLPRDGRATQFDLPGGWFLDGERGGVRRISGSRDDAFRKSVVEDVTHAWYKGRGPQHPWQGETEPDYTDFQDTGKYTWVKAPRFQGKPMQVGPLGNLLVGYGQGRAPTRRRTDDALARVSKIAGRPIGVERMQSTMGRYLARAIRSAMLAELAVAHWERLVDNISKGDVTSFVRPSFPPTSIEGVG